MMDIILKKILDQYTRGLYKTTLIAILAIKGRFIQFFTQPCKK